MRSPACAYPSKARLFNSRAASNTGVSAINKSRCRRAEHHPTRWCHRFHPLGHPDLFTDGGVTRCTRTDFTGDHLTGVKSHPQLQIHTVAVFDFSGHSDGLILNAQGSETGTNDRV